MDECEKHKRFAYKFNSNLVIQTNQRNRENAPSGEAESLVGKIKYKMGDLALSSKPKKSLEKSNVKHLRKNKIDNSEKINILDIDINSYNTYTPTTVETRVVYEEFLDNLTDIMGSQPGNILKDTLFELMTILKDEEIVEDEKLRRCSEVLGDISIDDFKKVSQLGRKLTDFNPNLDDEVPENDDPLGVAVVFDEDNYNNQERDYLGIIQDGSDEDYVEEDISEDEVADENNLEQEYVRRIEDKSQSKTEKDNYEVEIHKIDAYWLQRELYSIFKDAEKSLEMEKLILDILKNDDSQECENSLVTLFNYEHFSWIKTILMNQWKIYYCTLLGQASSEDERAKIIEEMKNHPEGANVLDLINKPTTWKSKDFGFLNSIKKQIEESHIVSVEDRDVSSENKKYMSDIIDFDQLYMEQTMNSNISSKVVLPEGSEKIEGKEYDEIIVPPLRIKQNENIKIVPIDELPKWCHPCFKSVGIDRLNLIQSKVCNVALNENDENILVCAPTGSGKTNIALLCILNTLSLFMRKTSESSINEEFNFDTSKFKIVYISPMKALVTEQVESLRIRLKPLGIVVNEMTGDTRVSRSLMESTQIFITTPEKLDVITRKMSDGLSDVLKLIIIDEIHMLHDTRGAVLEGLVARFKDNEGQINSLLKNKIRLVGLSATLPNYLDVARFLEVNPRVGLFYFGPEYRPVPLKQTYIGIREKKGFRRLQMLNSILYEKIMKSVREHQILVFVHSRKDTIQTAKFIRDKATSDGLLNSFFPGNSNVSREILLDELSGIKSDNLKDVLPCGIAIHHAGLVRTDRKIVEDLFADGHIQILVTTATLAWGVNLPAHTVIIKGTQVYKPETGQWSELSPLDIFQMIGRGGRPQYDIDGHGIIITDYQNLTYYSSLFNQQFYIESQLISKLPDIINAEIVLGNIQGKLDVLKWIKKTFLYIRLKQNPKLYGLNVDSSITINTCIRDTTEDITTELNDELIENYCTRIVESALLTLDKLGAIQYDYRTDIIIPSLLGQISSLYYLSPETVQDLEKQLYPQINEIQLFRLLSFCKEFKFLPVRSEEKSELEKLVNKVPIPVQGTGEDIDTSMKVNVLIQLYLTGSRWINSKLTLLADLYSIVQASPRICRALFDMALRKGWSGAAKKALTIATMIERRCWEAMCPLRQFKGVSDDIIKRLEKKDIQWNKYYDFTSQQLGELLRSNKLGPGLYNLIRKIPKIELSATVQSINNTILQFDILARPKFNWDFNIHGQPIDGSTSIETNTTGETFWIFIEDCNGEKLYYSEMIIIKPPPNFFNYTDEVKLDQKHLLSCHIFIDHPLPPVLFIRAIADRWLHSETYIHISLQKMILLPKETPFTELLDLQPMKIESAFRTKQSISYIRKAIEFEDTYMDKKEFNINKITTFNAVQTQLFNILYNSNTNLFIAASPRSGQFICTCIAISRLLENLEEPKFFKVLYLCGNPEMLPYRANKLKAVFGDIVGEFAGNVNGDIEKANKYSLIISTFDHWDKVSRRLVKARALLRNLKLLIIDHIELLSTIRYGPIIESTISRIRYLISPLDIELRIIGYSMSISNAKDVAEWLGVSKDGIFSFHPSIRPNPIRLSIKGFDSYYRSGRILSMIRQLPKYLQKYVMKTQTEISQSKTEDKDSQLDNNDIESASTLLIYVPDQETCTIVAKDLSFRMSELNNNNYCTLRLQTSMKFEEFIKIYGNEMKLGKFLEICMMLGIGFLHEAQSKYEFTIVLEAYKKGVITVLIATENFKWKLNVQFTTVIIMDTQRFDDDILVSKNLRRIINYSAIDISCIVARCIKPKLGDIGNIILLCPSSKKLYYEYILNNAIPLESYLEDGIIDSINTEIALKVIKSRQDSIDWITWTFFYRRLSKNPTYYGLLDCSPRYISEYLSEVLENVLVALASAQCITLSGEESEYDDDSVKKDKSITSDLIIPLNLSLIPAYYSLKVNSIEYLSQAISSQKTHMSILSIISSVPELQDHCLIRKGEIHILQKMSNYTNMNNFDSIDISIKILILLNAYLNRLPMTSILHNDTMEIVKLVIPIIYAFVDVSCSAGLIKSSIKAMEIAQQITQAISNPKDKLLQLPHLNKSHLPILFKYNIFDIYDLIGANDNIRMSIFNELNLSDEKIHEIAIACNRFPVIEAKIDIDGATKQHDYKRRKTDSNKQEVGSELNDQGQNIISSYYCSCGTDLVLLIDITRDLTDSENEKLSPVIAPYYPLEKDEQWWIILLQIKDDEQLISGIRRVNLNKELNQIKLPFQASSSSGIYKYQLLIICDSYIGCDQEYMINLKVSMN
ncbi:SEC63 domain-containing protein [Cryptosporidium andersoni]|uniref:U5 small nuclear ribonucleoprotein 200 kDa helicase n=1 Tax=Cryptosporidium andersoni TaxID=117008 RepID=A0A1J4MVS0_9CRYT|nr:SEC63 domain-containing protein [Cryptosporidium andersoni]